MRRRFWLGSSLHAVRKAAVAYGPERFRQPLDTGADLARLERAEAQEQARPGETAIGRASKTVQAYPTRLKERP